MKNVVLEMPREEIVIQTDTNGNGTKSDTR